MSKASLFSTATTSPQPSPQLQQQQQHYQNLRPPTTLNPNQSQGVLYPVASSGRGFIPKPMRHNNSNSSDQMVTVANHGGYPPCPNQLPPYHPHPRPHLDASLSNQHLVHHQHHIVRPSFSQQQQQHHHHPQITPPNRGIPVSSGHLKRQDYAFFRNKRDKTIAIVRERKPEYGDSIKSLPRPLPLPVAETNVVKENEDEEDVDENNEDENVDHLSAEDLLRRQDVRTKEIERYKTSLSLLLPPLDALDGN